MAELRAGKSQRVVADNFQYLTGLVLGEALREI
jgi:hypothetical protein